MPRSLRPYSTFSRTVSQPKDVVGLKNHAAITPYIIHDMVVHQHFALVGGNKPATAFRM